MSRRNRYRHRRQVLPPVANAPLQSRLELLEERRLLSASPGDVSLSIADVVCYESQDWLRAIVTRTGDLSANLEVQIEATPGTATTNDYRFDSWGQDLTDPNKYRTSILFQPGETERTA